MHNFNQKQQPLYFLNTVKPLMLFLFFFCSFLLSCGGDNSSKDKGTEAKAKECKCIAGKDGIPIVMPKQETTTIEELEKACSRLKGHLQDCS